MSTPNFSRVNASKYYVLDDNEYFDIIEELENRMPINFHSCDEIPYAYESGTYINRFATFFGAKDYDFNDLLDITLNLCIVPGYYTGYSIDYEITVISPTIIYRLSQYDSVNDFVDDICEYLGITDSRKLKNRINEIITEAENVCSEICDTMLRCVGVTSNGEAFYEIV